MITALGVASAGPAQAATTPVTADAGATWTRLMTQKLGLDAQAVRLRAALPALRTTATARSTDLARAQTAQTAAATKLISANTTDLAARDRYVAAKTALATAKQEVTAEQQRKPGSRPRVESAKQALTAAEATVRARGAILTAAWNDLAAARTALTTATNQIATATTAYQAAATTVTDMQQQIAALPGRAMPLLAQATALGPQVVTQTRPGFTAAGTTRVYGITVNKIVAYPFQRMLDDAAKAGVPLSGGGFRTLQQQIALRTINGCPDVWTAPASSCRVPTAIPGRSLHELGLAVDLTFHNKTITDRTGAAFQWLTANAARYGFANLPSEPWHWSITGN